MAAYADLLLVLIRRSKGANSSGGNSHWGTNKLAQIFIKSTVGDLASIEKQVAKTKSSYGRFMHARAGP
jgi:hypothetical protein